MGLTKREQSAARLVAARSCESVKNIVRTAEKLADGRIAWIAQVKQPEGWTPTATVR
jgi:hypothetical protein